MASSLVLTEVYLDSSQKTALNKGARETGLSVASLICNGVDAIRILDEGTKRAKQDIDAMLSALDKNGKAHRVFMRAVAALGKAP